MQIYFIYLDFPFVIHLVPNLRWNVENKSKQNKFAINTQNYKLWLTLVFKTQNKNVKQWPSLGNKLYIKCRYQVYFKMGRVRRKARIVSTQFARDLLAGKRPRDIDMGATPTIIIMVIALLLLCCCVAKLASRDDDEIQVNERNNETAAAPMITEEESQV